jgi:hypothetical protein
MSRIFRASRIAWLIAIAIALGCSGLITANAWSGPVNRMPAAEAAGSLPVNDSSHLHLVHASGPTLAEEGRVTGTLPGKLEATLTLKATTATSQFTIVVGGSGSITGHGAGDLHEGHGGYESFAGEVTLTHGSGRYAHASGSGRIYGTIDRLNDNAVVQVIGVLHD